MIRHFGLAATLVLGACAPSSGDAAPASTQAAPEKPMPHPESGLPVIPLTVEHGDKVHSFRVELAQSTAEQARGLMFRTKLGPDEGMLFPMHPPRIARFWMHNTVISLDLIFIGYDGRIINIVADAVPYDESPLMALDTTYAVLELNGGRAAQLGLQPGDLVKW
jgi:uncharacterized membrane protein (UPF0127 family)